MGTIKANPDASPTGSPLTGYYRLLADPAPATPGFYPLDPSWIPAVSLKEAASLSGSARWAKDVPLDALGTRINLLVTGPGAVTRSGKHCGKGHGYADLE